LKNSRLYGAMKVNVLPLADAISAHGTSHVKPKLPVLSHLQTKEGFDKTQGLDFTLHSKATGSRSNSYDTENLPVRAKLTTANWIY
jgi:hypothetical protein